MERVNQQTLADRLGLSRATVSRCFTNHRSINPATRHRVFELAAELGYRYMELRTPPADGAVTTKTAGVLICDAGTFPESDRFERPGQKLLEGVSQLAQLCDMQIEVHHVNPEDTTLKGASYRKIPSLRHGGWDGALLIYSFPESIIDALLARFPCVSLVEQDGRTDLNCVDVDHHRGISAMLDRLVSLGHKRIGLFSTHSAFETYWTMHRFSAYFSSLSALGLEYRPVDVVNVLSVPTLSQEEALQLVQTQTLAGVTAWVCTTDYAAYSVMAHLAAQGIRVPEEVSVTGFDGIDPPEGLPAVTTIEIPFREIGRTGAGRLFSLIERPFDPTQHILLGCQLREGETVGPVAGGMSDGTDPSTYVPLEATA